MCGMITYFSSEEKKTVEKILFGWDVIYQHESYMVDICGSCLAGLIDIKGTNILYMFCREDLQFANSHCLYI